MACAFSYPETDHLDLAMTTLPIPVREETADAFRNAPPATQEWFSHFLDAYFGTTERTREEKAEAVERAAKSLSASAKANGWTDEMDEALLRGDLDDDE